jgi:hypothetical protein
LAGYNLDVLMFLGVSLLMLTSLGLLLSQNSLWGILLLAAQYLGVFVLVRSEWPLSFALSKLLAGWIATAVLWMAIASTRQEVLDQTESSRRITWLPEIPIPYANTNSAILFRLLAAVLVDLAMFSLSPNMVKWVPGIALGPTLGALILIGMGLLHLGLTTNPLRVIFGLLTVLAGFEILYAAVEVSALVAGLLAGVTMGLALLGAYFLLSSGMEEVD